MWSIFAFRCDNLSNNKFSLFPICTLDVHFFTQSRHVIGDFSHLNVIIKWLHKTPKLFFSRFGDARMKFSFPVIALTLAHLHPSSKSRVFVVDSIWFQCKHKHNRIVLASKPVKDIPEIYEPQSNYRICLENYVCIYTACQHLIAPQ